MRLTLLVGSRHSSRASATGEVTMRWQRRRTAPHVSYRLKPYCYGNMIDSVSSSMYSDTLCRCQIGVKPKY
eukprot:7375817-Prymnesium_polylepis.6